MAQYGYPDPEKDPKTLPKKTTKKIDILRKATKALLGIDNGKTKKPGRVDRQTQFSNYLSMIDRLNMRKFELGGRVRDPGTILQFASRAGKRVATTQMSTIMDRYHEKALRMAQAKYYAKQVG
jgi:hypothetical protein